MNQLFKEGFLYGAYKTGITLVVVFFVGATILTFGMLARSVWQTKPEIIYGICGFVAILCVAGVISGLYSMFLGRRKNES